MGAVCEFSPASTRHPRPSRRTAPTGALKTGLQGELRRVGLEIFDDLSARGIAAVSLRYRQARQAGAGAVSVQMQSVVVAPPDRADGVGFLKDRGVKSASLKRGRRGEAGGTCADDNGVA